MMLRASVLLALATGLLASLAAAEEPPPPKDQPFKLYWKDGATSFETDDFAMTLSNRIQFRFTDLAPDDAVQIEGTEGPGDHVKSFRIRRAKTELAGWFWKKEISFELQMGWAGSDSTGGSSTFSGLEDALLNWDASKKGTFQIRAGQFKVPFGRQEMTSSERQQFADRSILSGEFTLSRDIGVQLWGQVASGKLEYRAGAFNGNGRNHALDDNNKLQYDARLMFQPWGDVKYSEGDFESTNHPLLAIAGGFQSRNQHLTTNANDFNDATWSTDAVFKYRGASLYAEHFWRSREPETGASFGSNGWIVQAGAFVKRNVFELAFRYAAFDPSDRGGSDDQSEIGGAANYYFLKHRFKLQADYRAIKDESQDQTQKELRAQLQFVF